ncbi:unnamed protein product [Haemonchus placei]|uniref:HIG1 domain-containing protein n=1 Tax=Haemonchus placei TaxID=6290 RepID=A0A0N4WK97_HAEPC|nr:unnamed protein product [Haemonchus placei]
MGIFSWFNSNESNPSPSPDAYSPPSPAIQENEDEGVMTIRKGTYEYDKQHKPLADSGRVLEEGGKHEKYTSIPSVPVSGRFNSENMVKSEVGGGAVSGATSNPAVLVGLGATTLALLAIMKSSYYGDKLGIPSIPVSGRFNSENMVKSEVGGGAVSGATSNPAVLVGLGATTLALLAIMKSSYYGDKLGVQKSMRYRIMAQFFTVTALVAGATYFATRGRNQTSSGSMFHKH